MFFCCYNILRIKSSTTYTAITLKVISQSASHWVVDPSALLQAHPPGFRRLAKSNRYRQGQRRAGGLRDQPRQTPPANPGYANRLLHCLCRTVRYRILALRPIHQRAGRRAGCSARWVYPIPHLGPLAAKLIALWLIGTTLTAVLFAVDLHRRGEARNTVRATAHVVSNPNTTFFGATSEFKWKGF